MKIDNLYEDYNFSHDYPIMGKIWKFKCRFCGKDLRRMPKDSIVKGEVYWGWGEEGHLERHWWCNESCAKKWYSAQKKAHNKNKRDKETLNERIKGRKGLFDKEKIV